MWKRTVGLFSVLMLCFVVLIFGIYTLSTGEWLKEAAMSQSVYKLRAAQYRGTIYDTKLNPLTDREKTAVAAVNPTMEAANALSKVIPAEEKESVYTLLSAGKPFLLELPTFDINCPDIDVFSKTKRYTDEQLLTHVIGYLDGEGHGVAGIEKAYDELLSSTGAQASVTYQVNATGRVLAGEDKLVDDTSYLKTRGVVLTIDERIQKIAEDAAKEHLDKGAVIVTEVGTGKMRAVVSAPDFSQNNVAAVLSDPSAPLINRAFSSYNVGSVFKLVAATVALESGVDTKSQYNCTGSIEVDGSSFSCYGGVAHHKVNMKEAIAHSCNTYFVQLAQQLPTDKLYALAQSLGFGKETKLAPSLVSDAGIMPKEKELQNKRTLANFSFGQGELLATPLQIACLINSIASGGEYHEASLVEGIVDEGLNYTEKAKETAAVRVMSKSTADTLKKAMISSVEYGTSKQGKPKYLTAAAKTATAETGIQSGDHLVEQSWFAGMYPAENPRYVVVVLAEDGEGGGASGGPVFKEICEQLYEKLPGLLQ